MVPFIDDALIISQAEPYFLWLIFFFDLELLTSIRTVKFCFAVLFKIKPEERRRVRGWTQARFFSVIVYSDDLPLKRWLYFKSCFQVVEAVLGGTNLAVTQCHKMMVLWPFPCFCVVVLSAALSERAALVSNSSLFECQLLWIKGSRQKWRYSARRGMTKHSKVLNLSKERDFLLIRVTEQELIALKCNFFLIWTAPHTRFLIAFLSLHHSMSAAPVIWWPWSFHDPSTLSSFNLDRPSHNFTLSTLMTQLEIIITFITARIFSQFSSHCQCSNKIHYSASP